MKNIRLLIGVLLLKSLAYLCVPPAVAQEFIITDPNSLDTKDIIKPGDSIPSGGNDTDVSGGDTTTTYIEQLKANKQLKAYPNPASDRIHFPEAVAEVRLLTLDGKLLKVVYHARRLEVADLPRGIYILRTPQGAISRIVLQ